MRLPTSMTFKKSGCNGTKYGQPQLLHVARFTTAYAVMEVCPAEHYSRSNCSKCERRSRGMAKACSSRQANFTGDDLMIGVCSAREARTCVSKASVLFLAMLEYATSGKPSDMSCRARVLTRMRRQDSTIPSARVQSWRNPHEPGIFGRSHSAQHCPQGKPACR